MHKSARATVANGRVYVASNEPAKVIAGPRDSPHNLPVNRRV
jgi:hypothetical protein